MTMFDVYIDDPEWTADAAERLADRLHIIGAAIEDRHSQEHRGPILMCTDPICDAAVRADR